MTFCKASKDEELVARVTNYVIRGVEILSLPLTSRGIDGLEFELITNNQLFNHLCLYNEAFIRNSNQKWFSDLPD